MSFGYDRVYEHSIFCVKITVWYSPCEFIQCTSMKTSVLQLARQSLVCETDVVVVKRVEFPALIRRDIVIFNLFVVCSLNVCFELCQPSVFFKPPPLPFVWCSWYLLFKPASASFCVVRFCSSDRVMYCVFVVDRQHFPKYTKHTTGRESTSAIYFWKCQFTLLSIVYRSQTNDKGK